MGKRARVDEHTVGPIPRLVNVVDERAFVVALEGAYRVIGLGGSADGGVDLVQRHGTVDVGFAGAEEV